MFDNIYGHESQKRYLESAISEDKISHSYMFYGKSGIGKKMLAFEFAKNILGVQNLDTCVDYKYICRNEGRKDVLAEQIREGITDDVSEKPISGKKKVYIIDEAEKLNDIAQNILLKTLEGPPSYVVIIMVVSNISMMLPTILSRVNKIEFNGLSNAEMNKYVSDHNMIVSHDIVEFVGGSVGMLEDIIKEDLVDSLKKVSDIAHLIISKDIVGTFLKREEIDFSNVIFLEYLEYILFNNKLYNSSLEIKNAISRLKMNGNYDILIDNMLLRCIESA